MIVCHCNFITKADVEAAVWDILRSDPSARLDPQSVYAQLGKRGKCCGCFPQAEAVVADVLNAAIVEVDGAIDDEVTQRPWSFSKEGS